MALFNLKKKHLNKDDKTKLLDELLKSGSTKKKKIIYGVYDNSKASWFVKLNDFYIDHYPVSLKEKAYFFHLLGVLVDGGVPIEESLGILAGRTKNEHFKRVLDTLGDMVKNGRPISAAMMRFPDIFDEAEVGIIKSGEAIGALDKVLFKLSQQLDRANELKMKIFAASVYPMVVMIVLILVMIGMFAYVLPILMDLLTKTGLQTDELPFATRTLVFMQNIFAEHLILIVLSIVFAGTLFKVYIASDNGRFWWHYYLLKLPVLGTLIRKVSVLRFVDKFGLLMDSGLAVVKTMHIIATSTKNEIYALHVWRVIGDVEKGTTISNSLAKAPFLFPEDVTAMLAIGEKSGTLAKISGKVSEQYDKEITHSIKRLTSLFEPVVILFVGLFVAIIVLAVMGPIFTLTTSLSQ